MLNRGAVKTSSDVAGAFDRVSVGRLVDRQVSSAIHPKIILVLTDWLVPRSAYVVCNGQHM